MDLQFVTREYLKASLIGGTKKFQFKPFSAFLYSVEPFSITDLCVYFTAVLDESLEEELLREIKANKIDCFKVFC